MSRFFVSKEAIGSRTALITGEDVIHIGRVLRMREGDTIILCDGEKNDYLCEIAEISKKEIKCNIIEKRRNNCEPSLNVALYQGVPKGAKMEYLIQKCVEMGVYRIVPVITERTIARGENKTERWNKVAMEAAKQSGRGIIPQVTSPVDFSEALAEMIKNELAIMPYEGEEHKILRSILRGSPPASIGVMIGPEGGFSEAEVNLARSAGAKVATLGKRILRTETAGMFVLSSIMYELDE